MVRKKKIDADVISVKEPEVTKPTIEIVADPKPENRIPLKVFLQLTGLKFDQLAGFRYYAEKNYPQPRSRNKWQELLNSFMAKTVK